MNRAEAWRQAKRILCVRLDALGDVLMTTPAIGALRDAGTQREISLLTSPAGALIAPLIPIVDRTLCYEAPWMKASAEYKNAGADREQIERLRREQFDAAVIFTVYSQNPLPAALLCYLAEIPLRLAHCRENPYQLLTDWAREREPEHLVRHEVQRQLDLVATIGAHTRQHRLALSVPAAARKRLDERLRTIDFTETAPWVVIHPGSTAASRRYPPEQFAAVARMLVKELGLQVLFTGVSSEGELVEEIRAAADVPSLSLAGCLPLDEFVALIERAPVLLSNNSGPVHIAAAVGTPVVDLYALTNPQHTPWAVPHRVLFHDVDCKYCYRSICPAGHHDCLRKVEPKTGVTAVKELLGTHASSRAV